MANNHPIILMVGYDRAIFELRSQVLERKDIQVFSAETFAEAIDLLDILSVSRCDLVVIGSTVPLPERTQIAGYITACFEWIKVLSLTSQEDRSDSTFLELVGECLDGSVCLDSLAADLHARA